MFLYEGMAYDLIAAAVGVLLGVTVAYGMVLAMVGAFSSAEDVQITYSVKPTTFLLGYAIGVLLTLVVVAFSAWRVSRMNIVTAIRDLPEPPEEKHRRRRWLLGAFGVLAGGALAAAGVSGQDAVTLGFGVSLVILGLVPILRVLGVPDRAVYTGAGLALVAWFVLPISRWLFGAGPADVDGLPAEEPLPDRGDARDVHARRLHPCRRRHDVGGVHERVQRHEHLRRRLRRAGHDLAGAADRPHALGARADAGREAE
jgi:hypothetical protein